MISQLEREVTFRFLKTRKNDGFLNIISIFSFIGISLGVAVLIIVMSVMNGFRTELISKIVGFNAHAVVQPGNKPLEYIQDFNFAKNIVSNDGEAVILNKDNTKGVFLKGYQESDFKNLQIVKNEEYFGSKNLNDNAISIGKELSFNLNVDIGDIITVMSPAGIQTLVGNLPKQENFKIVSIISLITFLWGIIAQLKSYTSYQLFLIFLLEAPFIGHIFLMKLYVFSISVD